MSAIDNWFAIRVFNRKRVHDRGKSGLGERSRVDFCVR